MKIKNTVKILAGFVVILMISSVFVSVSYSSKGSQLVMIEKQISELTVQNEEIRSEIIHETSLRELRAEVSTEMGEPMEVVYISSQNSDLTYNDPVIGAR